MRGLLAKPLKKFPKSPIRPAGSHFCSARCGRVFDRLRAVSLFSVVRRAKRETRAKRWWQLFEKAATIVSGVSRLRRSRARALPLLNRKKKRDCSQSKCLNEH